MLRDAVIKAMLDTELDVVMWKRSFVEELADAMIEAYKRYEIEEIRQNPQQAIEAVRRISS